MSNDGIKHVRLPQDSKEEWLVSIGWNMVGLSLWEYSMHKDLCKFNYSKKKAVELSKDLGLTMHCPTCGNLLGDDNDT